MARPKKNEQLEPTKNTQEEIEAALARACGQNPTPSQPIPQPTINDKVFKGYKRSDKNGKDFHERSH